MNKFAVSVLMLIFGFVCLFVGDKLSIPFFAYAAGFFMAGGTLLFVAAYVMPLFGIELTPPG